MRDPQLCIDPLSWINPFLQRTGLQTSVLEGTGQVVMVPYEWEKEPKTP